MLGTRREIKQNQNLSRHRAYILERRRQKINQIKSNDVKRSYGENKAGDMKYVYVGGQC